MKVINGEMVFTRDDARVLRGRYRPGYTIRIRTPVWVSSYNCKLKTVKARIAGVYPNGMNVYFTHRNWKCAMKLYRFIPWNELVLCGDEIPTITRGKTSVTSEW